MSDRNSAVAVYDSHSTAEQAVQELRRSGLDMKKLSIVGKDYHTDEHIVGYLIAHGTPNEVSRAKKVLVETGNDSSTLHLEEPVASGAKL